VICLELAYTTKVICGTRINSSPDIVVSATFSRSAPYQQKDLPVSWLEANPPRNDHPGHYVNESIEALHNSVLKSFLLHRFTITTIIITTIIT